MSAFFAGLFIFVVAVYIVFSVGFIAGKNSAERYDCIAQGYEWINGGEESEQEDGWLRGETVTCIKPIVRIAE